VIKEKAKNYTLAANRYIKDILSGRVIACHWVKQACQRQLDDLQRPQSKQWPYKFDTKRANRICQFAEGLPHIKGEWAKKGMKLTLEPWQVFIYTTVLGWINVETGFRRFKTAYCEVSRKNGKSTLSAPLGIYMTCADEEAGAEVYSAATTRDQAKISWESAKHMVDREPGLRQAFDVDTSAHSIHQMSTASSFKALSSESNTLEGLNVHCAIIDELHAHKTREVWDVLETACGARKQPLRWTITTAGSDRSGICYEQRLYVTKILDNIADDPTYFGIIYTLDPDDDWKDESLWIKANPNLNISVDLSEMHQLAAKAKKIPSALSNFLTKRLDIWVNASVNLFNITAWQALADKSLKPEDFMEDPCWVGEDFAPRNDFSSRAQLFRREQEDGTHYYVFCKHFLSEGKIEESDNASYDGWAREGWIQTNPGNQTDDRDVEDDAVALFEEGYQIQEYCCDPSRTQGMETRIGERTEPDKVIEVPQNARNLCPATEKLSALIADGKIHHNGDPVLTWMLSNTVGRPVRGFGAYPDKERPENKIDGVSALLTALSRAMLAEQPEPEYMDYHPLRSFNASR
jgi:phage terminase large subunit-like protein